MKTRFLIILLLGNCNSIFAQAIFSKIWDYRYGGTKEEIVHGIVRSKDGGFLIGGASKSGIDGDVTQDNHDPSCSHSDFWIIKVDSAGTKQWDKRYGGDHSEYSRTIINTRDGGYLLAGYTESDMSGDMSEFSNGGFDFWMIKIDSAGNKQWDKTLGGNSDDCLYQAIQTWDGGYLLGGLSYSDSVGDRSQPSRGRDDFWVIKTDSVGNRMWDKRFGTNGSDLLTSICQANDGGYMLLGWGQQGISDDKQFVGYGNIDYWLIKIDDAGNTLWDSCYGGTRDDFPNLIIKTHDNGFILGGTSNSDIGGVKTEPSNGSFDWWIVMIDSVGNKIWDKDFGCVNWEPWINSIYETDDYGLLISGASTSDSCSDKSENNLGDSQSWIIKTDANGNKLWEKTLLTPIGYSWMTNCFTLPLENDSYISASTQNGGIGGYKSQPNWDITDSTFDFWVIKSYINDITNGVIEEKNDLTVKISPTPSLDFLNLEFESIAHSGAIIRIYNLMGDLVLQEKRICNSGKNNFSINIQNLSNGIYPIMIETSNGIITSKIIKVNN